MMYAIILKYLNNTFTLMCPNKIISFEFWLEFLTSKNELIWNYYMKKV